MQRDPVLAGLIERSGVYFRKSIRFYEKPLYGNRKDAGCYYENNKKQDKFINLYMEMLRVDFYTVAFLMLHLIALHILWRRSMNLMRRT
jgi:hypothetical protein